MELIKKINNIKTNKELSEYKAKIDEAFEKRKRFITLCEIANENSNKSFGYIKESFENISGQLFTKRGGKKLINNYMKTIKENKNLSSLYSLYENIRKTNVNADVDFFINNIANTEWSVNKNIKEDTLKLGRILAEAILLIGDSCVDNLAKENKTLDNAVKFLSENKKTKNNIAEYSDAIKIIREHVNSNNNRNSFETVDIDSYVENILETFNKKYSNLTEEEINIIKKINISENKEEVFNQYKTECLNKISNYMNSDNKNEVEKLTEVFNKIKSKTFVLENIGVDVCGFVELTKLFE